MTALAREAEHQVKRRAFWTLLLELSATDPDEEADLFKLAERMIAEEAMARARGRQDRAADLAGVSRRIMHYKVHKHRLPYIVGNQMKWGKGIKSEARA